MRLVDSGATWYKRVSRNLRSTSYSDAKPNPPWHCKHALAASQEASAATSNAVLASGPQLLAAANNAQALKRIKLAASTLINALAMGNCTPWFCPIGRPNTIRSVAYLVTLSINQ